MSVSEYHTKVDRFVALVAINQRFACTPRCFWCCYEPLYVDEREVDNMLRCLAADQRQRVEMRTKLWQERSTPLLHQEKPDAVSWRKLMAPCPFLEQGLCMVYNNRPFSCRTFFALEKPENCELPYRENQLFAHFSNQALSAMCFQYMTESRKCVMDHLGVIVAEKLFGIHIYSAVRAEYEIPKMNKQQRKHIFEQLTKTSEYSFDFSLSDPDVNVH